MKNLALFDLDHTLLSGDSDHSWGRFLVDKRLVDPDYYHLKNEKFYKEYINGELDIHEYCEFAFQPFTQYSMDELETFRREYITTYIQPLIDSQALKLVQQHQAADDLCIIITATNAFVTTPIAELFQIEHLIATEPEVINNQFTGKLQGIPCFQGGKLVRLEAWLNERDLQKQSFENIYSYSDSYNDLPLLEFASHPSAVNPDQRLKKHAVENNWPIIQIMDA